MVWFENWMKEISIVGGPNDTFAEVRDLLWSGDISDKVDSRDIVIDKAPINEMTIEWLWEVSNLIGALWCDVSLT